MQESLGPMIDSPGRYDTLETWEQFSAKLEALPSSITRNLALAQAKHIVQVKRREEAKAAAKVRTDLAGLRQEPFRRDQRPRSGTSENWPNIPRCASRFS